MKKTKIKTKTKTETIAGEDTYAGALRAPRAGSPAFVSVFVFVLIFVFFTFDFRNDNYFDVNYISEAGVDFPSNTFNLVNAVWHQSWIGHKFKQC